jgi:hypothetical protein
MINLQRIAILGTLASLSLIAYTVVSYSGATNGSQTLQVAGSWSGGTSGNTITLRQFNVEELN